MNRLVVAFLEIPAVRRTHVFAVYVAIYCLRCSLDSRLFGIRPDCDPS